MKDYHDLFSSTRISFLYPLSNYRIHHSRNKHKATEKTEIVESLTALPINPIKSQQNKTAQSPKLLWYSLALSGRNLQQTPSPIAHSEMTGLDA